MTKLLVDDTLWAVVAPLRPKPRPKPQAGRPRVSDRACLSGIVFVLQTGIQGEDLPPEMGCGCGMTCWRRLRDWQAAGVWWDRHRVLLDRLGEADRIDWSRASSDSSTVPAKGLNQGGRRPRRSARSRPLVGSLGRSTTW